MPKPPVDVAVLTVIHAELEAALAALEADPSQRERSDGGSIFVRASVESALLGRPLSLALGCIGEAGNANAAAAVTEALARFHPSAFLLVGIAAGLRDKTRIGEVVLSDRVVAYEPAALLRTADGRSITQARPEVDRVPHEMAQDVVFYHPDSRRLRARFDAIGGRFPTPANEEKRAEYDAHVASDVTVRTATIASGEKLLRDPDRFRALRDLQGKIEVGEMEAAGVVDACRRAGVPWLVVRGISDFGDDFKDDRFHALASKTAAVVLVDFLQHGYSIGLSDLPRNDAPVRLRGPGNSLSSENTSDLHTKRHVQAGQPHDLLRWSTQWRKRVLPFAFLVCLVAVAAWRWVVPVPIKPTSVDADASRYGSTSTHDVLMIPVAHVQLTPPSLDVQTDAPPTLPPPPLPAPHPHTLTLPRCGEDDCNCLTRLRASLERLDHVGRRDPDHDAELQRVLHFQISACEGPQ